MEIAEQLQRLVQKPLDLDGGARRIAHVVSVTGAQAIAMLEPQAFDRLSSWEGRLEIGTVVKIRTPRSNVIGIVTGMSIPVASTNSQGEDVRVVELELVGETVESVTNTDRYFRRGVVGLPALGDPVYRVDQSDLAIVYAPRGRAAVQIGTLYQDPSLAAYALVDDLLAKHFAIVGTTGSGKSCALSCILQGILSEHTNAHIVVLDIHDEYSAVFRERAELINPSNLQLPFWLLSFEELADVLVVSDAYREGELLVLADAVTHAKRRFIEGSAPRTGGVIRRSLENAGVTVETPTPYRLADVIAFLDEQLGRLEHKQNMLPYRRLKARIDTLTNDARYSFIFGNLTIQDTMADILGRIFRIPVDGRPITIIDLSAVPSEIMNVVISVLCRLTFDLGVWSKGALPITLVCEEAHRYAPSDTKLGFEPTRRALARIAKEGRKYGISLGLVTQRPSELDPTILSQCNTLFAMRLGNDLDQQVLKASTSDNSMSLFDFLPSLGDGEAIALGQGVPMPMRIRFKQLNEERVPSGKRATFSSVWSGDTVDRNFLDKVVSRWRYSRRESD